MHKTILFSLLILVVYTPHNDATDSGEPWKKCRPPFESLIRTIQNAIKGLEDDKDTKEMHICGKDLKPCEKIIITNLRALNLTKEDPCSRPCTKGNQDCFQQFCPFEIQNFEVKCLFSNELTFLVSLLEFVGMQGAKLICQAKGMETFAPCKGYAAAEKIAEVGGAVKGGLDKGMKAAGGIFSGKRDVDIVLQSHHEVKREEVPCVDQMKQFFLGCTSKKSLLFLNMTNDWENDKNTIDSCSFKEESLMGMECNLGGGISLLGKLGEIIKKILPVIGKIIGFLFQQAMSPVISKVIKENPTAKENLCMMNCGD